MLNRVRRLTPGIAALFTAMLITLVATGCGLAAGDLDITFYRNERYTMSIQTYIPPGVVAWIDRSELEQQLDDAVAEIEAEGADASWSVTEDSETGALTYMVTIKGKGYQALSEASGIEVRSVSYHGRQAVEVVIPDMPLAQLGIGWQRVTLHGAKILESDGIEMERGVVSWPSPTDGGYAILTPKGSTIGLLLLLIAMGIAGGIVGLTAIGAGAYIGSRLRRQKKKTAQAAPTGPTICPHCGARVPQEARFCTSCGRELPTT